MNGTIVAAGAGMRTIFLTLSALVIGCNLQPESPKPHSLVLDDGSEYVPNPELAGKREYWVVIRAANGRASMFPRPDGASELGEACSANDAFAQELQRNALCQAAPSQEAVTRVNALDLNFALRVSTYLHQRLYFKRIGDNVAPYPYADDLLPVCKQNPSARATSLKAICDRELEAEASGSRDDIWYGYTASELETLPPLLNALYGK